MASRLDLEFRDELIERFLRLGYNHAEILSCLLILHDRRLSLRELKRIRLRWPGHVVRMSPERLPRRLLFWNPCGRRRPGRQRMRWQDSITRDLQSSISFEEAVTAAQNDRSAWRSFVLALCGRAHGSSKVSNKVKRILARRGLKRRQASSDLIAVLTAVEQELQGSGSNVGYRSMWQRLVTDYGLAVCKDTVKDALRILDADGVDRRAVEASSSKASI